MYICYIILENTDQYKMKIREGYVMLSSEMTELLKY